MEIRRVIIFLLSAVVLIIQSFAQTKDLNALLYSKQYPQLEAALSSPGISENDKILYKAFLLNAFNQPEASDHLLAKIFHRRLGSDDDTLQFHLHRIAYDNGVKLNDYASAYAASEMLLQKYPGFFDASEWEDQKQESKIWKCLRHTPGQKVTADQMVSVLVRQDLAGLWTIPVGNDDSAYDFVFDTGAGISTITDSYAGKLKLEIIKNSSVDIQGGINGISTRARLGVAKQLQIGKLIIQNAVFFIFPDSALSFAGGAYTINGIIGLPVIKSLGEIIITKDKMTISLKKAAVPARYNMILDLLNPVIYINFNGESLPCTFDCGAQTSLFSDNFYNRYKQDLLSKGKYDSTQIGGAGGSRTVSLLEAPELGFTISDSAVRLKNAQISLEPLPAEKKFYYANIGQDVINQFDTISINFLTSTISFAKKK